MKCRILIFIPVILSLIGFSFTGRSEDFPPLLETPDGSLMVLVPQGRYWIGSDKGPRDAMPRHNVPVNTFYIDRTEVTNRRYLKFCLETGHKFPLKLKGASIPAAVENLPVVNVSHQDALEYARWAHKRLPTEAQWEIAARGSDERIYPWGNKYRPGIAALRLSRPVPVGSRTSDISLFGAMDLAGNVKEWTDGWYRSYPGAKKWFDERNKRRVVRGGGFCSGAPDSRAFVRHPVNPAVRSKCIGFRCVREIKR